jgi:hypothetical protein
MLRDKHREGISEDAEGCDVGRGVGVLVTIAEGEGSGVPKAGIAGATEEGADREGAVV